MKSFEVRNNGCQVVDMYGVVFTKKGNIAVTVYGGSCVTSYIIVTLLNRTRVTFG